MSVTKPEILLLEEPLGALDALTGVRLQDELLRIWQTERITMILVTHDVEEAIYLSNRVIVMHGDPGRVAHEIAVNLMIPYACGQRGRFLSTAPFVEEDVDFIFFLLFSAAARAPAGLASTARKRRWLSPDPPQQPKRDRDGGPEIAQDLLAILECRELSRRRRVEVPFDERIDRQHERPRNKDEQADRRGPALGMLLIPALDPDPFGNAAKDDRRRENKRDDASDKYDDTNGVHHLHVSLFGLWISS
jgi:hypothetical protein